MKKSTRLALAASVVTTVGVILVAMNSVFYTWFETWITLLVGIWALKFILGSMIDKKEDGLASLSAAYLAFREYKKQCPWIDHAAVKTDGAGAYSASRAIRCTMCSPTSPSAGAYFSIR